MTITNDDWMHFPCNYNKNYESHAINKRKPCLLSSGIHKCVVSVPKKKHNGCHNPIFSLINMHVVITQTKKLSSIIWVPSENGLTSALEARSWKHSGSEISWLTPHCCMSQKMWEVGQKDNLCTFHDMHQKIHSECKQPRTQHYNPYEKKYMRTCVEGQKWSNYGALM